jgi:hypothetical protein
MGGTWVEKAGFGLLIISLTGCWSTQPSLRPPPRADEYILPPAEEARFSNPIEYPKELLNADGLKKKQSEPGKGPEGRAGMGGPPGV